PRCLTDLLKAGEQMHVQHFLAEGPVEAFDEGVLVWLARLDVLDGYAIGFEPLDKGLAQKLRAVVAANDLRQLALLLQLLEHADQALGIDGSIDLDVHHLAVEVVKNVEGADAPATGQ